MATQSVEPGPPAASVAAAVYAEQVDIVVRQAPLAIAVNLVSVAFTAIVLARLSDRPVLAWLAAMVLVAAARGVMWKRYRASPDDARTWSLLATGAAALTGLVWGIGGAVLFPALSGLGEIFLATMIGGMCAGSVVVNASHLPTLTAFIMSAVMPMALGLLADGSPPDRVLGAMAVLFAVSLTLAGRRFGKIFAESLRLRFELNAANLQLRAEMAEHRVTEAALNQAQKLEAVGHLTGGVAHDFNNLLTVVIGNATLLRDEAAEERTRRRLTAILSVAERGERLTRQLLTFSRRQTLRPEPVVLQQRADDIRELLVRCLRENITVTVDLPDDLWPVAIDPGEFDLALLNIAVNARDAMPDGGQFGLVARDWHLGQGPPSIGLTGDFVSVTLSDTGTGMPPEVMARAFEPYFTTKTAGLGSGLGLSQVYGFANQSGGTAVITSKPRKGTDITLFLPRADTTPRISRTAPKVVPPQSGRILLVEDDAEVAEATEDLLRSMGFETQYAQDGNAALSLIEGGAPVDLVLSDVVMPGGLSGLDLARALRQRRPTMPVILATGYSQYAPQVISERFTLIEKPYQRDRLASALQSALEAGRERGRVGGAISSNR